jgi:hypothetical protein
MTEGMSQVGRSAGASSADEQEDLVDRVRHRMQRLGEHRRRSRDPCSDSLGDGYGHVGTEGREERDSVAGALAY